MTAGPWITPNAMRAQLLAGNYGNLLAASAVKVALFGSASNLGLASTVYSGLTDEVAAGDGYTTGGQAATLVAAGVSPAAAVVFSANVVWTATSAAIPISGDAPYYAAVYVPTGGYILAYCLLDATPAAVTVPVGDNITLNTVNPIMLLQ